MIGSRAPPPAGGSKQWVDGYSATEQAKAWLRTGVPAIPSESPPRFVTRASASATSSRCRGSEPGDGGADDAHASRFLGAGAARDRFGRAADRVARLLEAVLRVKHGGIARVG
jgi:hypothetical protein